MEGAAVIDGRTPVLVGVGQHTERVGTPEYRRLSAVDLAAEAARVALADAGVPAAEVDTVLAVRQFEVSTPQATAPLGRSDNVPRSVAQRIGADPRRAVLDVVGGQSPQALVTEAAQTVADGGADVVLVVGAEAISTARALAGTDDRPDFSEHVEGSLEDRGLGLQGLVSRYGLEHALWHLPGTYALFENARRTRLGLDRAAYDRSMGELFAPFTEVAARNPYSAAPVVRTAEELLTITDANRVIATPYPRYLVARDQVNQGAAVLVLSVDAARRLGVPEDRWVFLHGHADVRERELLERQDLGAYPAAVLAVRAALELAGLTLDDVGVLDLYSCFPVAVSALLDGLGLAPDDPRGLTVTGGLPFFGGPGNDYSLHAIASTVERLRAEPGTVGLVGANGGVLSKYSVGVYATTPAPWRESDDAALQAQVDAWPAVPWVRRANGPATVEDWTVLFSKDGTRTGVVVGRDAEDRRFLALAADDLLDLLETGDPAGVRVHARSSGKGNRVALTTWEPRRRPALRDDYAFVQVRRDGHVLEVVMDRPEVRNALHPPANEELDEVFDAFFADPTLWVAVLSGSGGRAFSAGNDLVWTASGQDTWVPENGFAGLTSRPSLPKPVIAAVDGYALGGGFEIALACHLVVAAETAQFGLTEARVGLVAAAGGLARLPRMLPSKLAHELVLTGRRLSAQEALAHGLVNRVVPAGRALEGARALAQEVLESSPTSVRLSLQVLEQAAAEPDVVKAVALTDPAVDALLGSEDLMVGLTAFATKQTPEWTGR
ncbi:MAG: putative enoyl-CoA hydratase [Frankiales bacterium]|nr:putative enoyl-CoA hydratase [Frankiales bacterium]